MKNIWERSSGKSIVNCMDYFKLCENTFFNQFYSDSQPHKLNAKQTITTTQKMIFE